MGALGRYWALGHYWNCADAPNPNPDLLEVIIPRVFDDGCAAQFRVNAVPGQSMLSLYKQKRAREHMFVLRL